MFTYLLDGTRSVRTPLVAGYSVLLTAWLALYGNVPDQIAQTSNWQMLREIYAAVGPVGHVALWSFVALMVGSLLSNLFFDAVVRRLVRFPAAPDWDSFVAAARAELRRYEEFEITLPKRRTNEVGDEIPWNEIAHVVAVVPSQYHGEFLRAEVEARERRRAEVEFRMALSAALVPPALALAVRGGPLWALAFIPSLMVWLDMGKMQDRTRAFMNRSRRAQIEREISELRSDLSVAEQDLVRVQLDDQMPEKRRVESEQELQRQIDRVREALDLLSEEQERLATRPDEYFTLRRAGSGYEEIPSAGVD